MSQVRDGIIVRNYYSRSDLESGFWQLPLHRDVPNLWDEPLALLADFVSTVAFRDVTDPLARSLWRTPQTVDL